MPFHDSPVTQRKSWPQTHAHTGQSIRAGVESVCQAGVGTVAACREHGGAKVVEVDPPVVEELRVRRPLRVERVDLPSGDEEPPRLSGQAASAECCRADLRADLA
eukprot:3544303-Prymnesium_polylepis.1